MKQMLDEFITQQITAAYVAGYNKCLEDNGQLPKYLSLNAAWRRYGRPFITKLVDAGIIDVFRMDDDGRGKCVVEREKIEAALAAKKIKLEIKSRGL